MRRDLELESKFGALKSNIFQGRRSRGVNKYLQDPEPETVKYYLLKPEPVSVSGSHFGSCPLAFPLLSLDLPSLLSRLLEIIGADAKPIILVKPEPLRIFLPLLESVPCKSYLPEQLQFWGRLRLRVCEFTSLSFLSFFFFALCFLLFRVNIRALFKSIFSIMHVYVCVCNFFYFISSLSRSALVE